MAYIIQATVDALERWKKVLLLFGVKAKTCPKKFQLTTNFAPKTIFESFIISLRRGDIVSKMFGTQTSLLGRFFNHYKWPFFLCCFHFTSFLRCNCLPKITLSFFLVRLYYVSLVLFLFLFLLIHSYFSFITFILSIYLLFFHFDVFLICFVEFPFLSQNSCYFIFFPFFLSSFLSYSYSEIAYYFFPSFISQIFLSFHSFFITVL